MEDYLKEELNVTAERNRRKIQAKIISCAGCQPYDEGMPVWIHGVQWELDELFADNNVPEEYWEAIASHLYCPNCGTSEFTPHMDVGIKSRFDIELDNYINQTLEKYKPQIKEFDKLIEKTPLLAYSHKFGRKLYKDLKELELPVTSIKGQYFRAREAKNSTVLTKERMMHPPTGKSQEGRYNHSGQSHLYLSKDKYTAVEEVIGGDEDVVVWTIELEVDRVDKILDLTFDWTMTTPDTSPIYFALCGANFVNQSKRNLELWKPDYFLTRYIMDCTKELGYNGIKYNSNKSSYIENVVLFYPEKVEIKPVGDPELQIHRIKRSRTFELIDL